jgi:hypothetical protein
MRKYKVTFEATIEAKDEDEAIEAAAIEVAEGRITGYAEKL